MSKNKIAIVHEWLVNYAGSEKCVESFTNIWPDAPVYSLVDFLNDEQRAVILNGKKAKTSFIQHLPYAKNTIDTICPFSHKLLKSFNLSNYELVVSSSHAVAKGCKN